MIKKTIIFVTFCSITVAVYIISDARVQLFNRSIGSLLYSIVPDVQKTAVEGITIAIPGLDFSKMKEIESVLWKSVPIEEMEEYCQSRINHLNEVIFDAEERCERSKADGYIMYKERITDLKEQVAIQKEVIGMYATKAETLFTKVKRLALSAFIGQIITLMFLVPYTLIKRRIIKNTLGFNDD